MRVKLAPLLHFNPHTDALRSKEQSEEVVVHALQVNADIHAAGHAGAVNDALFQAHAAEDGDEDAVAVSPSSEKQRNLFVEDDSFSEMCFQEADQRVLSRHRCGLVSFLDCIPGHLDITRTHVRLALPCLWS